MDSFREFLLAHGSGETLFAWAKEFFLVLLTVVAFWGIGILLRQALTRWGPRLTRFTRTDLDNRIFARIGPPVELLVLFAGIYLAVQGLSLPDQGQQWVAGTVFIASVAVFTTIGYRLLDELLRWYARRVEERTGAGMGNEVVPLLRKVLTIFLVCGGLMVVLKHFGYDVLSLITAMGIGSLAIGLAAKDTLANMISGFTLLIDRPFRIGDRIQLATGKSGDVADIGLRSTRIRTAENTLLIIPNSELCNSTVLNMAFPDPRSQGRITVGVAYGSDVEKVKMVMADIAAEDPDILNDPPAEAYFVSFGDTALAMTLIFWVNDYTKIFKVTDRLNGALLAAFARNGIEIPYPTRKVLLEKE